MAKNCTGTALYQSLIFCQGKTILPGIKGCYFARKADIATFPTLPDKAETNMNELSILKGSFTMGEGQKFHKIDLNLDKGQLEYEVQGEYPSVTFLNKGNFIHQENDEDAAAFARQAVADDLILVVPTRDGKWRVLGNEAFRLTVKPKGTSGEGVTGQSGTTLEVSVTDVCPAPFYEGDLVTDEGNIKCGKQATGGGGHAGV